MPELGRCTQNEATALAGLAPFNIDSGTMRGKRKIKGGRTRVRNALYMAAVVASRGKTRFADFYRHLTAKGKPAKLALTAVARKILITAHALIRDERQFRA
jgi:transposase